MALRQFLGVLLSPFVPRTFGAKIVERQQLVAVQGSERLRLLYRTDGLIERLIITSYPGTSLTRLAEKPPPSSGKPGRGGGLDFHSLVWESNRGGQWRSRSVLSARQAAKNVRSWVCDLHSFDPATGTAVVRVGQMRTDEAAEPSWLKEVNERIREVYPQSGRGSWCEYSWVIWNLRDRKAEKTLRVCKLPNEPLDG